MGRTRAASRRADGCVHPWLLVLALALTCSPSLVEAQTRPGLVFREDWKESAPATPMTQEHVANPDVVLSLHGPGAALIKKSHHDQPADDPYYVWSGDTTAPWAVSLRRRGGSMDLSGQARIRWRTKQSGFHELRIIVQLATGQWLVADQTDGPSSDWREREFVLADLGWRELDVGRITEGRWVERPDLSRVAEVGWTDLRGGGGTPASSRLDWMEVYGRWQTREPTDPRDQAEERGQRSTCCLVCACRVQEEEETPSVPSC